tara:strand:+ start:822 stop:1139 length:318 start_codon:yes stop_codon:yes gene_type:complete
MGMFDKLSGSGFGDFFGNAFTKKIIGQGFKAAFGGSGDQGATGGPTPSYSPFRVSGLEMPMERSSEAGIAKEIETTDFSLISSVWNQRLFGNNSYTNITLPRFDV